MNNIIHVLFALLLITNSLSGCTVKEDRNNCPCRLVIRLDGVKDIREKGLLLSLASEDGYIIDRLFTNGHIPDSCVLMVPKRKLYLGSFSPPSCVSEDVFSEGCAADILTLALGEECPEIWMDCGDVDARDEVKTHTLALHKSYCRLNIRISLEGKAYPFLLKIDGVVSGYGAFGVPKDGPFSVRMRAGKDGLFSVSLPRQKDNSLRLNVIDGTDLVRSFAIGEYIAESGYDWQAEDLKDIDMVLDLSKTTITLKIDMWSKTIPLDILI